MASWESIVSAAPDLAAHVRRCFAVRKHCTVATLRRDGSPRISGTEIEFGDDGDVYLGMLPASVKALDLRRDPRLALHGPTVDPPEDDPRAWLGDAKLAGRAVEVAGPPSERAAHRFRIDVTEVVLTTVAPSGVHLRIRSWHPGRGVEETQRR